MENSKRYSHIINPQTGYPAEGVASSTLITDDPAMADALATAVFVCGPEKGFRLISIVTEAKAVMVTSGGELKVSPGLEGSLLK